VTSVLRQRREEQRKLLTRGERVFAWSFTLAPSLLVLGGIALLVGSKGTWHGLGIALLIAALLLMAFPISPFLRARVRRREARTARRL
jgi:hypothetical protein